ncbi:MAG: hypothetical protein KDD42_00530 [Bdellovibrionales bacterium]|nr:hypothetical protein [Bdellovibrionales bacterium]
MRVVLRLLAASLFWVLISFHLVEALQEDSFSSPHKLMPKDRPLNDHREPQCDRISSLKTEEQQRIFVDRVVQLSFEPTAAFLFIRVWPQEELFRVSAEFSAAQAERDLKQSSKRWLFGAKFISPSGAERLESSLLIIGEKQREYFADPVVLNLKSDVNRPESVDGLRELLLQRKKQLKEWRAVHDAQAETLADLRVDADRIANLQRIVDLQNDLKRVEVEKRGVETDIETLRHSLQLVNTQSPPRRFTTREAELTRQLAQLTSVARSTESEEQQRQTTSQLELQRKLDMIESNSLENVDDLHDRLQDLRRRREILEKHVPLRNHFVE